MCGDQKLQTDSFNYVVQPGTDQPVPMNLSEEQINAVKTLETTNKPVAILTGRAGAGKSTVINCLRFRHPEWTICSTTGKSACLIQGRTVDSVFGYDRTKGAAFSSFEPEQFERRVGNVIIIDEASMVGLNMFNYIQQVALRASKRLILVGDWGQAAPVKDAWFFGSVDTNMFELVKLNECHRQSQSEFLDCLDKIRNGIQDKAVNDLFRSRISQQLPEDDESALILFAYNKQVNAYNSYKLKTLLDQQVAQQGRHYGFRLQSYFVCEPCFDQARETPINKAEQALLENCPFAKGDMFAVGAKVLITLNNVSDGYVNGDTGIVTGVEKYKNVPKACAVKVLLDRTHKEVSVGVMCLYSETTTVEQGKIATSKIPIYGFPLKLGYALSIHKSQGMTIPRVWVDVEGIKNFHSHGLLYVALSRVRNLEDIEVSCWYDQCMCKVDSQVKEFL